MSRYAVPYTVAPSRKSPAGSGTLYVRAETPEDALARALTIHRGETTASGRRRGGLPKTHAARITYRTPVPADDYLDPAAEAVARLVASQRERLRAFPRRYPAARPAA